MHVNNASATGLQLRLAGITSAEESTTAISTSATWQRVSVTRTFTNAQSSLRVDVLNASAGNNATIEVWAAQLEAGSTPTPFQDSRGIEVRNHDAINVVAANANSLTYSEQLDNARWQKTALTVQANSITAPNGTTTADKIVEDASASEHSIGQRFSGYTNYNFTASAYFKKAELSYAFLELGGATYSTPAAIQINLNTGTTATATGTPLSAFCTAMGLDWYRCGFTLLGNSVNPGSLRIYTSADGVWANRNHTGTSGSGLYVWGLQVEEFRTAGTYQVTTDTPSSAAAWSPNMLAMSERLDNASWIKTALTVTVDATTTYTGAAGAEKLVESTASSVHSLAQTFGATGGYLYSASFFLKAGELSNAIVAVSGGGFPTTAIAVDLSNGSTSAATGSPLNVSCAALASSWYRCGFSVMATANSASSQLTIYTSNDGLWANLAHNGTSGSGIYAWGAQVEQSDSVGSYVAAGSAIPFAVSDYNRQNITPWYNANEGTLAINFGPYLAGSFWNAALYLAGFYNPTVTTNNLMDVYITSARTANFRVTNNGATYSPPATGSAFTPTANNGVAIAYKLNDFARATNGGSLQTSTSGAVPAATYLGIGAAYNGGTVLNGTISRVRYWPVRLSNTELQNLSQ